MQPSERDKRIRIFAGLGIMALTVLSAFFIFASSYDDWFDVLMGALYGFQSLFMLAVGIYLVSGRGKARTMVQVPGPWPRIGLAVFVLVGTAAIVFGFIANPENLGTVALWPNLVGVWILLQFRSIDGRFQHTEEWTTPIPLDAAMDSLTDAFCQPGLKANRVRQDVWLEIRREWTGGTWLHADAARHMKTVPGVHFRIDEIEDGTRITAHSGERTVVGMYDVLKLSDEMSATAVKLAKQVTTHQHEGLQS